MCHHVCVSLLCTKNISTTASAHHSENSEGKAPAPESFIQMVAKATHGQHGGHVLGSGKVQGLHATKLAWEEGLLQEMSSKYRFLPLLVAMTQFWSYFPVNRPYPLKSLCPTSQHGGVTVRAPPGPTSPWFPATRCAVQSPPSPSMQSSSARCWVLPLMGLCPVREQTPVPSGALAAGGTDVVLQTPHRRGVAGTGDDNCAIISISL